MSSNDKLAYLDQRHWISFSMDEVRVLQELAHLAHETIVHEPGGMTDRVIAKLGLEHTGHFTHWGKLPLDLRLGQWIIWSTAFPDARRITGIRCGERGNTVFTLTTINGTSSDWPGAALCHAYHSGALHALGGPDRD